MGWSSGTRLFERIYNIITDKFGSSINDEVVVSAIAAIIVAFEFHDWDNLCECDEIHDEGTYLHEAVKLLYPDYFEEHGDD